MLKHGRDGEMPFRSARARLCGLVQFEAINGITSCPVSVRAQSGFARSHAHVSTMVSTRHGLRKCFPFNPLTHHKILDAHWLTFAPGCRFGTLPNNLQLTIWNPQSNWSKF